jgi:hypothetical protein
MPKLRVMETIRDNEGLGADMRDGRLGAALSLLQKPSRHRTPGVVPLLAGCAFIGAATLLAYVTTKEPGLNALSGKPMAVPPSAKTQTGPAAHPADFELSASSIGASPGETVTEAVPLGSESAR